MRLTYRYAARLFCCMLIGALISACGSRSDVPIANTAKVQLAEDSQQTFYYTGAAQSFKVPSGVTQLTVTAYGAGGGGKKSSGGYPGSYYGGGGRADAAPNTAPAARVVVAAAAPRLPSSRRRAFIRSPAVERMETARSFFLGSDKGDGDHHREVGQKCDETGVDSQR
jgi:hypothetical protein